MDEKPINIIFTNPEKAEIWYYTIGTACYDPLDLCAQQQLPIFLRNLEYDVNIVVIDDIYESYRDKNLTALAELLGTEKESLEVIEADGKNIIVKYQNYTLFFINQYLPESSDNFWEDFKAHLNQVEEAGGVNMFANFAKFKILAEKQNPLFSNDFTGTNSPARKLFAFEGVDKSKRLLLEWFGYDATVPQKFSGKREVGPFSNYVFDYDDYEFAGVISGFFSVPLSLEKRVPRLLARIKGKPEWKVISFTGELGPIELNNHKTIEFRKDQGVLSIVKNSVLMGGHNFYRQEYLKYLNQYLKLKNKH